MEGVLFCFSSFLLILVWDDFSIQHGHTYTDPTLVIQAWSLFTTLVVLAYVSYRKEYTNDKLPRYYSELFCYLRDS